MQSENEKYYYKGVKMMMNWHPADYDDESPSTLYTDASDYIEELENEVRNKNKGILPETENSKNYYNSFEEYDKFDHYEPDTGYYAIDLFYDAQSYVVELKEILGLPLKDADSWYY